MERTGSDPEIKRVSLDKTPELNFWGLNICLDLIFKKLEKN